MRAVRLVDAAAKAGFSAVKTQHFRMDRLYCKEALLNMPGLIESADREVPEDWHKELKTRANGLGMLYGVSMFDARDIDHLLPCVDFWKVASYSLLDLRLLAALALTKLPIIVSTGMADMDECLAARLALMEAGALDITFLHCVTSYPAPPEQANLKAIDIMQKMLCWPIGWSDHTIFPPVVQRAVERWGAKKIEIHFDLEDGKGVESEHSYTPRMAANLIASLRDGMPYKLERVSTLDGDGVKKPQKCEEKERRWRADPSDGMRPTLEERKKWTVKHSTFS